MANALYDDTDLTPDERRFLAQAESGKHYGEYGQAAGNILGAATGLIPVVGPAIATVASPVLGKIGSLIGEKIGGDQTAHAEKQLQLSQQYRNQPEIDKAERMKAVNQLLGQWTPYL